MEKSLITTFAAVVLAGCGESQQSAPAPESKPVEPVAKATKSKPPTAKAPDISIYIATRTGNIEAVKQHLAAGTDVNAKDDIRQTPLHFAATKEIAELLISKGADVNAKDWMGRTPLRLAAGGGHKEVVELLIAKGAEVNTKSDSESTPLHIAALKGYKEIVELLLAEGADVNAKIEVGEYKGQTPLDIATLSDNPNKTETSNLLRKHGGKTGEELKAEGK